MKTRLRFAVMAIILLVTAWYASSQDGDLQENDMPRTSSWSDLAKSEANMHAAMALVKPSGISDAVFVGLMIPHHQAAIDMAKTELMCGKDAQMRRLAQEIITDQQSEIELMQLWLKQRGTNSHK